MKFYLYLIHFLSLEVDSMLFKIQLYKFSDFLPHCAFQSYTGTRIKQCVNSFLLCNMSAVSNNRKITDKKYRLHLIQELVGNVQNKVKQEDHKRLGTPESTSTLHILE
jgi:hypothetical protein